MLLRIPRGHWLRAALAVTAMAHLSVVRADEANQTLDLGSWKVDGQQEVRTSAKAGILLERARNPLFYKNEPGVAASGSICRPIKLRGLHQIRVRFAMDEPPLAGMGVQLSADRTRYAVIAAEEGRFVLAAEPPFYGGPGWRQGQSYEVRITIQEGKLFTSIVAGKQLPVPVERYTRPIPETWQNLEEVTLRIGFLSKQRPERGDSAGTARLLAVRLFEAQDEIPPDVEVSSTLAETLGKYHRLASGTLTPPLARWVDHQKESDIAAALPQRFEVQAWDGSKIGRLRGWEEQVFQDIKQYYTLLQFRGAVPEPKLIAAMGRHDLRLASSQSTRQSPYYAALADSPHVLTEVLIKGKPQNRANRFNGDLVELAARQTLLALAPVRKSRILKRVMLDSEHKTGIGLDPLAQSAARQAGIEKLYVAPQTAEGPYQRIVPDDDPRWQSLNWYFRNHHADNCFHQPIAKAIHRAWPGVEVTTDPIFDYGSTEQFAELDVIQHWIRVHYAPRNPRSVAFYCERARVHVRHGQGQPRIVIGPQLGRNERATPPDMLSEACWLAVAFGARGITHWGQQAIWQPDGSFSPGGRAAWDRLKRLKRELYDPHTKLLLSWKPRKRRLAILYSLVDLAYASGARHTGREACENMYRGLLSLGEPADVIYDEEILSGRLNEYRTLVVPSLYVANRSLVEKIHSFIQQGGRVIAHEDSILADIDGVAIMQQNLTPVYRDYAITKGEPTLLPHEYAEFLVELAESVRAKLPFAPIVQLDRPDVIANLMVTDDSTYVVLVNDRRQYGPEAAALGHRYMLDQGVRNPVSFRFAGTEELKNISTGEVLKLNKESRFQTTLEPGWGAILRVLE